MRHRILPVTHYQQNCSLIWCENTNQAALIDPGGDVERLLAAVQEEGVELSKIILTHGHLDHVGGTAELVAKLGLPVEGPHKDDSFWLDMLPTQAQMMGFAPVASFTPNRWLNDGDTVTLGDQTLAVYHCPGHTPGHVILHHKATKKAFVGDVLFKGSIGRTDFPRGDYEQLVTAIRSKLWPLGDDVTFVPGHGPTSTFGEERASNPFVSDKRLKQ
ncbi:MBL fold metallo-hydrolase [Saccharophagus degradans]|uniref:MBL fold metallo-hydrolase n=1 Tax=Saccharophagus degradans TaxID=86304 RepID=A0AAW7X7C3_9GAMM|nr:MBL fold metallo-hydrolase [Saccharophagus degradans]MBU2984573.1 MBL fold metallo-hydrolase [Saccharophagus degradans]MDO6423479.1 MBL fold metallo-hydrolase [Saccharophagus degradans]MDO6606884.1 MBL fold metallo-hydrolase [Saccharophagus degradans]